MGVNVLGGIYFTDKYAGVHYVKPLTASAVAPANQTSVHIQFKNLELKVHVCTALQLFQCMCMALLQRVLSQPPLEF